MVSFGRILIFNLVVLKHCNVLLGCSARGYGDGEIWSGSFKIYFGPLIFNLMVLKARSNIATRYSQRIWRWRDMVWNRSAPVIQYPHCLSVHWYFWSTKPDQVKDVKTSENGGTWNKFSPYIHFAVPIAVCLYIDSSLFSFWWFFCS